MNYATPLKAEDYFPGNEKDVAKEVDEQIMYSTSTFTKRGKKDANMYLWHGKA